MFVIRKTLTQMAKDARLDEVGGISVIGCERYFVIFQPFENRKLYQEKRLWVEDIEVGVVYMRCGYHPDQYPTQRFLFLFRKNKN